MIHVASVSTLGPGRLARSPRRRDPSVPARGGRGCVYARTKRAGESLALEAARAGRDVVVANPGFLIGPGDVYRVSTWMVRRYLQGTLRVVVDGGLSFVDARDVAAGLVLLAERGRAGERTILTNREGNLPLAAFFSRLGEVTGVRRRMVKLPSAGRARRREGRALAGQAGRGGSGRALVVLRPGQGRARARLRDAGPRRDDRSDRRAVRARVGAGSQPARCRSRDWPTTRPAAPDTKASNEVVPITS